MKIRESLGVQLVVLGPVGFGADVVVDESGLGAEVVATEVTAPRRRPLPRLLSSVVTAANCAFRSACAAAVLSLVPHNW